MYGWSDVIISSSEDLHDILHGFPKFQTGIKLLRSQNPLQQRYIAVAVYESARAV